MPFSTILIANRGEIACRVARTAHALGYQTVAVYSDADRHARHVRVADRAVHLGPSEAAQSYLSIERLIAAAQSAGGDALHPGYGFLAENAALAEACEAAGIVFIGPPASAIRAMGKKREAKLLMIEAGVPVIPGYSGADQDDATLIAEAERIGMPVMIKASAGGGGRGMRLVTELSQVLGALAAARAEAISAFGSGELILERAVQKPRHVEIQIFADTHGNVVHLGERDCSVQRRHQKVIEEAPSPAVTPELRAKMGAAAVEAARAIGYVGAGTVELLLAPDGDFYFMEMNTRLQVEHPVTELITGLDLVAWQLQVAAGGHLPLSQEEVTFRGHAMEVRLYAEDPDAGFLPQVGRTLRFQVPNGEGVRVDHGLDDGQEVTAFYDAMVAKIVAHGRDREEARRRLVRALRGTALHGLICNRDYLLRILDHPAFAAGQATTDFVVTHAESLLPPARDPAHVALAVALAASRRARDFWRSTGGVSTFVELVGEGGGRFKADVSGDHFTVSGPGVQVELSLEYSGVDRRALPEVQGELPLEHGGVGRRALPGVQGELPLEYRSAEVRWTTDGVSRRALADWDGHVLWLTCESRSLCFELADGTRKAAEGDEAQVAAPMAGKVVEVRVQAGQRVEKGAVLVVLEAMKMQLELTAPRAGTVAEVRTSAGRQVQSRQVLVELAPLDSGPA